MILIVGLGNPGKDYEFTRHNIGFRIVDKFTEGFEKKSCYRKFNSLVCELSFNNQKLILLKPQTFMNNSGISIAQCCSFFGNQINSMLVIHDDIDIGFGEIRLKSGGSTGGHKGLESIVASLGNCDFDRLRFGIGRPPGKQDAADYVLEEFKKKEKEEVEIDVQRSVDIIRDYLTEGIEYTMNKYN
ncbi:MAG TPA: aminoacyl-tRNA hydrolase [Candidatus Hydromicrobium sp.]